jgi:predicted protein tyrosine phosphatase
MNERREKNWKLMYTRNEKLQRAKKLGFEYPISRDIKTLSEWVNILFICSRNQWRSPTAENIYKNHGSINVRSAGTSGSARRKVTSLDLKWADLIFVMEDKHIQRLVSDFPGELKYKEIHVLDIPDDYKYMDPDLIELLINLIDPILYNKKSAQQGDAPEPASPAR